ncbi:hypothetical protein [Pseudopedobacter beijingensis]|uniref:Auto-transporter adhesin head GIN domain-containing protein n=1 Tax=Pseudopedobacter beijingensis TaxID=1207056 RepID=A0ABW4IGB1_9SPHI
MKIKSFCLFAFSFISCTLNAQEMRTTKSGEWGDMSIWERKSGEDWRSANDIPRSASNVTIQASHTVVLTQEIAPTCSNLTIEKGAVLKGKGGPTLRIGTGKNSPEFKLINNGVIESGANVEEGLVRLDVFNTAKKLIISGEGETNLARFGVRGSNPNKLEVVIDTDLNITERILTSNFSAMDNVVDRRSSTDDITVTINKGKIVKIINQSTFHSPTASVEKGGKYTYNILGTLDISQNGSANHLVSVAGNPESAVDLNVGGQFILGQTFNVINKEPSAGRVSLIIQDGGLVDATKTKRLTLGANQFKIEGTGILKR